jgi:hypothetical protein
MDDKVKFEISIEGPTPRETEQLATELYARLDGAARDVQIKRSKKSSETLEIGSILTIVLSSAAFRAVGNGVASWLANRQKATITIKRDGTIIATGLTSADAARVAQFIRP